MIVHVEVQASRGDSRFELEFDSPKRISIGRGSTAHVQLPDVSVSSVHATLHRVETGYEIVDEGSTNGTKVNGQALTAGQRRSVQEGDQFVVGRVQLTIRYTETSLRGNATSDLAIAMSEAALVESGDSVDLSIVLDDAAGTTDIVHLGEGQRLVLGSGASSGVRLAGAAPMHAEVRVAERVVWLEDLGALAGSRLDGRALAPRQPVRWSHNEVLAVGPYRLTLRDPVGAALQRVEAAADEELPSSERLDADAAASPALRRRAVVSAIATQNVGEPQGRWAGATASDFGLPPASPIEAMTFRDSEPPPAQRAPAQGRSVIDALVLGGVSLALVISAAAGYWLLTD